MHKLRAMLSKGMSTIERFDEISAERRTKVYDPPQVVLGLRSVLTVSTLSYCLIKAKTCLIKAANYFLTRGY